jgi:hypothetical protein
MQFSEGRPRGVNFVSLVTWGYQQVWWQGDVEPPVPIPNTNVKRVSSETTCGETRWEDSPPPEPNTQSLAPERLSGGLGFFLGGGALALPLMHLGSVFRL